MPKPIKVDLPYPQVCGIEPNLKAVKIISPAYAGVHSELTATLQYIYHYFNFEKNFDESIANTLIGIAVTEMEHLEILGKVLIRLGAEPTFTHFPPYKTDFYSARAVSYSNTPLKMLLDDIAGEMVAISEYRKMTELLGEGKVSEIIARIILDEELHVEVLKDLAKQYLKN